MKFALVGGERQQPQPKTRGACVSCGNEMIAKCGKRVIWHWAHKSRTPCDPWWENETDWHRSWKNRFPENWQEVPMFDRKSGEKHIADIRTEHGLVIEFQRSGIHPDEVRARESFYKNMIWVVDGLKNDLDRSHFYLFLDRSADKDSSIFPIEWFGKSGLLDRWCTHRPVFIDFGDQDQMWRLLRYDLTTKKGLVGLVSIPLFVEGCIAGAHDFGGSFGPASVPE